MSERARLIGGTLQVDSSPGAGTMVSINLPLNDGRGP
jgi:signal transduction histidine kinase